MKRLESGVLLALLAIMLIGSPGCTAPAATDDTPEMLVVFSRMQQHLLEGADEAFAYILSGDPQAKMGFYQCMRDADALDKRILSLIDPYEEPARQNVRNAYGRVEENRTRMITSALQVINEYETMGVVSSSTLQIYEDDIDLMKSAFSQFDEILNGVLRKDRNGYSREFVVAVSLLKMQEDTMGGPVTEPFVYPPTGSADS